MNGRAYYNEIDPYCCEWLRNLIAEGLIAPGEVDDRDIRTVRPDDLRGFRQAHFFAGIAGWSLALRLAGWPDDRPVWTGSCPCQPFSVAGKGKASSDERHLWPEWFRLIQAIRPPVIFGEQVEAAIGWGWLDLIHSDLEAEGYAIGSAVLPACSVGAPHIRQRLWFVAQPNSGRQRERAQLDGQAQQYPADGHTCGQYIGGHDIETSWLANAEKRASVATQDASTKERRRPAEFGIASTDGELGDAHTSRCGEGRAREASNGRDTSRLEPTGLCTDCGLDNATGPRQQPKGQGTEGEAWHETRLRLSSHGCWQDLLWLPCTDGKQRPTGKLVYPEGEQMGLPGCTWEPREANGKRTVESIIQPLAHGISARVAQLRAAGNSIVPQTAAEFIKAVM